MAFDNNGKEEMMNNIQYKNEIYMYYITYNHYLICEKKNSLFVTIWKKQKNV